ncbi:MAG: hypothetical protein ABW179_12180 [Methylobacterium sp.]
MGSITMLMLFAIFGGICGFYLSVVGFAITALGICLLVGAVSAAFEGPFTPLLLLALFVAQQVGFFLAMIGRAIAARGLRLRARPDDGIAAAEFRGERDRT